jgi:hypothetical protein
MAVSGIAFCSLDVYSFSPNLARCEFHFHGGPSDDNDVTDLLKRVEAGGAVKVCAGKGNKIYYVATPVSKKNDVYYFYLTSVFKTPVSDTYRWEYIPPKDLLEKAVREVYMQVAANDSMRQDSGGFAQVQGVSTALFYVLNKAWVGILPSEKQFNEICCSLPILSDADTIELKKALYDGNPKDIPELWRVDFIQGNDGGSPHYTFSVANKSHRWNIDFDFNDDSIRIEHIIMLR